MELRQLEPEDRPAFRRLMAEAFEAGRRPDESDPPPGTFSSLRLGVFDGARLVAAAVVHSLPVWWGDAGDVPLGGVAAVACTADQRGRGHVARLLSESLRRMRDSGQYLSGLYPFAYAFYRRHGWEWVGEKREQTMPAAEIRASPEGRHLECWDGPDARAVVEPIYAAFARRYRGMTLRTQPYPDFWRCLEHSEGRTTYVHVHRDPATGTADGYLVFRFPAEGETASVRDFFALTPEAYRGLLSVLHYYGTQVQKVKFSGPADDPLPLYVMHHDLRTRVHPLFMGRVVDVAAAIAALRPDPALVGRAVIRVADGQCDWNAGTWVVQVEGGRAAATRAEAEPGIALDIQALSQAYWGQPSLQMLRSGGRVSVSDNSQFALLSALLPPTLCYLQDGF